MPSNSTSGANPRRLNEKEVKSEGHKVYDSTGEREGIAQLGEFSQKWLLQDPVHQAIV